MPLYHRFPSKRKINRMNARQRKKFHLGEFQALIFGVSGCLFSKWHTAEYGDQFLDEVIAFVEANSMYMYGGGIGEFSFGFKSANSPSLTVQQRQMVIDWFVQRDDVQHLCAGDLIDGYYADEAEFERYDQTYK